MKTEIVAIINQIPTGKVVSYGQIADQLDMQYGTHTSGWMVGRMMNTMGKQGPHAVPCPWRRVINKQGIISLLKLGEPGLIQIQLLKKEGVEIMSGERVDMKKYGFRFR